MLALFCFEVITFRPFPRLYKWRKQIIGDLTLLTTTTDDAALLRLARRGERSAFTTLTLRHRPRVWRQALQVCKNRDDAEDVVQETWIYALGHLADVREPQRLGAWLGTVALHCALDFRRRRATRTSPPTWGRMVVAPPDNDDLSEPDSANAIMERLTVLTALDSLSDPLRETLSLFYFEGFSHEEIARSQSLPLGTVRSRLARAKRLLRDDFETLFPERITQTMTVTSHSGSVHNTAHALLTPFQQTLIANAFPQDRTVSVEKEPEPWMPFQVRVHLESPAGTTHSVDVRAWGGLPIEASVEPETVLALTPVLARLGLPVPELLAPPQRSPDKPHGGYIALTRTPNGENLLTWTLAGNTPHRIRAATALGIAAIDRLHALTEPLLAGPVGASLARRTLRTDLDEIIDKGGPWLDVPLFADALPRLRPIVDRIAESTTLVYTNDLYFPNFLRVGAADDTPQDAPFGWPDDARLFGRQITEYVVPWGWFGDPLIGLAKFWTYDCYPFVHTGFVERYLYEKGFTARDLAPRLAVRALWTLQREVAPSAHPASDSDSYRQSLEGLLRHALQEL